MDQANLTTKSKGPVEKSTDEMADMDTDSNNANGEDVENAVGLETVGLRTAALSPKLMGTDSLFTTSRPNGKMRDVLTVECYKINESDFKGTINYSEAKEKIFMEELGLPVQLLHSLKMSYTNLRTISFKLKNQINLEDLAVIMT